MQFLFHTTSLASSGGSRVICNLASYLCDNGHKVTIVLDRNRIAFPINPNVRVILLKSLKIKDITPKTKGDTLQYKEHVTKKKQRNKKPKLRHKYKLINSINEWRRYLLKLLTFPSKYLVMKKLLNELKPNLVISHNMYYFLEHYAFYRKRNFCVVLHNSPNQVFIDRTVKSLFPISFFYKETMCIGVSKGVEQEMRILFPDSTNRTIYNPLDVDEIKFLSSEKVPDFFINNRYIVTVSSLAPGKRIDRTIKALGRLKDPDIKLVIIGEGEERKHLELLTKTLNLDRRVIFTGYIENPLPYMKNAELLSFTSDYEGFGLVLIEALACNTPIVSTDCPSGPNEILIDELKKYLIDIKNRHEEDIIDDLSHAMEQILLSPPEITYNHIKRFDKKEIVCQWEKLALRVNEND
ncbi:TPA: glycosyltransferase [Vibrio vulnificus]|nr:glycosyltransferase [Vibrio vulnificus]HDY7458343.1 glycosyltransferase [Vibrio vulnificus]HDY7620380.1 glycosyltransferase [Vibrio vulnificus]HDY8052223.1 glycosyltransferase [Vibrio vulnificus]HDY8056890.1 glycosyltransferase [Vibrio vulnificus]